MLIWIIALLLGFSAQADDPCALPDPLPPGAGAPVEAVLCTSAGPITVDLLEQVAPGAVAAFIEGVVVPANFTAEAAPHLRFGPAMTIDDRPLGFLHFDAPGWLAQTPQGFILTTAPAPGLDYEAIIFGSVTAGGSALDALAAALDGGPFAPAPRLERIILREGPPPIEANGGPALTQAAFAALPARLAALIPRALIDPAAPELLTTQDVIATAPAPTRPAWADYLARHRHDYRISQTTRNGPCDLALLPFAEMRYTLDAFATRADAESAFTDEALFTLALDTTFETVVIADGLTILSAPADACGVMGTRTRLYQQRGRFIAAAEVIVSDSFPVPAGTVLTDLVLILYERALTDLLRAEVIGP